MYFNIKSGSLVKKPRRATVSLQVQEERAAMLARAQDSGFVADYSGWRRSLAGTRFQLIDVLLWNVISPGSEDVLGQVRNP